MHPLAGLRVVELGSRVAIPYVGKLLVDAGAAVMKVESPMGDSFRRWSASGAAIPDGEDGAWWRFLNAGKGSIIEDLSAGPTPRLVELVRQADVVLDDHRPADAVTLGITARDLASLNPAVVIATVTPFGTQGPWADRPASDFILQALVGATNGRGIPDEEPVSVGGDLGDFVVAAHAAAPVLAAALAARGTGVGVHVDVSQYEAMMLAFQTYRPMFDVFAPAYRVGRQIEIPSIEPASDGLVGFCPITGQQWQDFCAMIGAPDLADDPALAGFDGRMEQRARLWPRIRAFTRQHTVDELVELAAAFRIPVGPVGTGDRVADIDHFAERGVFVRSPHGFTQPRPPYQFSHSVLADAGTAPALGSSAGFPALEVEPPHLDADPGAPLAGITVLDLSAFWAGPVATNVLRVLGADLVKVESHVRLDGMRWASGLPIPVAERLWEWSPVYHGANVGKRVVNLDLSTRAGVMLLEQLVESADLVIENYSPRVTESWGLTWDRIQELNPLASFVRAPAFGTSGPWRDRVGFAMTMEQVSGLANRTGHPDGEPIVPRGPVDSLAGMHLAFAAVLAITERDRLGHGQLIELPLIEGALQAAAEQVVEYSAYGNVLGREGNRSPGAAPQGLYRSRHDDEWVAISVETAGQWAALRSVVGELDGLDRRGDADRIDEVLGDWTGTRDAAVSAAELWTTGVPAAPCVHFNDSGRSPQHDFRRFFQWREHPVTGWTPYPSFSFQLDGRHLDLGPAAPLLGQHNDAVLAALGLSPAEVEDLWAQGVTGDWPSAIPRP